MGKAKPGRVTYALVAVLLVLSTPAGAAKIVGNGIWAIVSHGQGGCTVGRTPDKEGQTVVAYGYATEAKAKAALSSECQQWATNKSEFKH